jgi:hypothetical protein
MKRKFYASIVGGMIVSSAIVICLYAYTTTINTKRNGFIRFFPPHLVNNYKSVDIDFNTYYIAGISQNKIYLGNYIATTNLIISNYDLNQVDHLQLTVPLEIRIAYRACQISVDSPDIYMFEGITPTILSSTLPSLDLTRKFNIRNCHFDKCTPLQDGSFALRTFDSRSRQDILSKKEAKSDLLLNSPHSLEKQIVSRPPINWTVS